MLQCHSAHRYTIRHLVTNKETVEHASYIEYYEDEIASTKDAMRSQVAHETYGFKVSGIGAHERRADWWYLLPLWKGFKSDANERVWQDLDDVFTGIPVLVKRYVHKLLGSKASEAVKDGIDMCSQLGLNPDNVDVATGRVASRGAGLS